MTTVNITVKGAQASAEVCGVITTGTVGAKAVFSFDENWRKLSKTVVFRAGSVSRAVLPEGGEAVIPWEVLQTPNVTLFIGVYGTDGANAVIPTVWADCGTIQPGTDPEADPGADPALPLWTQMLARLEAVENIDRTETDPTVPAWAKEASPPSARSVGAIPAPEAAEPGQTVVVKAVDESGKPTQWEAVSRGFTKLMEYTVPETANQVVLTMCNDGVSMAEKNITEILICGVVAANTGLTSLANIYLGFVPAAASYGAILLKQALGNIKRYFAANIKACGGGMVAHYAVLGGGEGSTMFTNNGAVWLTAELKKVSGVMLYDYTNGIPAGTQLVVWGR